MYPHGELKALASRKAILQARIAVRRWESAQAAAELAHPIALVDRGVEMWRRISPFVKLLAVPGGLLLAKLWKSRHPGRGWSGGKIGMLLAALPAILRGVKFFQAMRATHAGRTQARAAAAAGRSG